MDVFFVMLNSCTFIREVTQTLITLAQFLGIGLHEPSTENFPASFEAVDVCLTLSLIWQARMVKRIASERVKGSEAS